MIAFWNINRILKLGEVKTNDVRKLDDKIIKGEFLYDSYNIITASKKNIKVNKFFWFN